MKKIQKLIDLTSNLKMSEKQMKYFKNIVLDISTDIILKDTLIEKMQAELNGFNNEGNSQDYLFKVITLLIIMGFGEHDVEFLDNGFLNLLSNERKKFKRNINYNDFCKLKDMYSLSYAKNGTKALVLEDLI